MVVGTKKRKEGAQSHTLYDFFRSDSTKKPKYRDETPTAVNDDDIIVISDDEPEQPRSSVAYETTECAGVQLEHSISRTLDPQVEEMHSGASNGSRVPEEQQCGDWPMEDDDCVVPQEEDEDEEYVLDIELADPKGKSREGEHPSHDNVCPICGQMFRGLFQTEMERHVNSCIDNMKESTPPSTRGGFEECEPLPNVQPTSAPLASTSAKTDSAFSILMSSHKENDAWKEASETEKTKAHPRGRRPAPFYKVMQGMPIAVDAFRYGNIPGVTAYFLSHAHSDHYTNLSSSWKNGPIYCSQTTANLIIHMLNVDPKWIHPLAMDTPIVIPDTGGVEVTLIQANHCPGSVLFLFKGLQTVNAGDSDFRSSFVGSQRVFRYLHCGDFRACPQHVLHSEVKDKKIDIIYLDTTYLDPKYCFPPQPLVISACAELACRIVKGNGLANQSTTIEEKLDRNKNLMTEWLSMSDKDKKGGNNSVKADRVLVVVGTYAIGKERIVKAIARALSTKVYCDPRKVDVLKCISDPELHAMLTTDPFKAGVHVVPLHLISSDTFKDYLSRWKGHWTKAVGFRPTGWTYSAPVGMNTLPNVSHVIERDQSHTFTYKHLRQMRNSTPTLMLYGVPYSEHSSFFELTCFALSLDWGKMIATVNVGSQKSRMKMTKWFEKWQAERSRRRQITNSERIVKYRHPDYW